METAQFFTQLWNEYVKITPQAEQIHALFIEQGEIIVNDHIAIRTFDRAPVSIKQLSPLIVSLGYKLLECYEFKQKHLHAESYIARNGMGPRIFISELIINSLNSDNQKLVESICQQIPEQAIQSPAIFTKGRLWKMPAWDAYQSLLAESDYAAWLSVMGLRANHFTISVNHLKKFDSLEKVNELLIRSGFYFNRNDGLIKGSPELLLEQSSTLADTINMTFSQGDSHDVTSCYYEFARRYKDQNKKLFQGFHSQSADKIFESTNTRSIS